MKKGMAFLEVLLYIILGLAILILIYFAVIKPLYGVGSTVVGKFG